MGDLAVITPHVEQASAVAARLADVPGVLIGTANQTQGLEREAVVVLHPLAGYREAPSFATDPGRLCVALSRHRAHATVIIDPETETVLRQARAEAPGDTAVAVQFHVLTALIAEA
jgi:superfamily I DNA and/or RNA helicase